MAFFKGESKPENIGNVENKSEKLDPSKIDKSIADRLEDIFGDKQLDEKKNEDKVDKDNVDVLDFLAKLDDYDSGEEGNNLETDMDDTKDNAEESGENDKEEDIGETQDVKDDATKELEDMLTSKEKLEELLDKYPNLKEQFTKWADVLNNPNATPREKETAIQQLKMLKGKLMEAAVIEVLRKAGLTVQDGQKSETGNDGKTYPDVVATNNTDKPIKVFGIELKPGETIYIESKCGDKKYMVNQLRDHIPNQLSGHKENSILLTTSDINDVDENRVNDVCASNDTTLVKLDISATDVDKTIKEVIEK